MFCAKKYLEDSLRFVTIGTKILSRLVYILNNHKAMTAESAAYKPIPVVRHINGQMIKKVFEQIKDDVREIIETEIANIKQDPAPQCSPPIDRRRNSTLFSGSKFARLGK